MIDVSSGEYHFSYEFKLTIGWEGDGGTAVGGGWDFVDLEPDVATTVPVSNIDARWRFCHIDVCSLQGGVRRSPPLIERDMLTEG